ncbi:hypothetical protein TNCV_4271881 [Trichonephila clavipes]|nr:hypothetical protein TNCV_4271881 [Trichonephila clavipes]
MHNSSRRIRIFEFRQIGWSGSDTPGLLNIPRAKSCWCQIWRLRSSRKRAMFANDSFFPRTYVSRFCKALAREGALLLRFPRDLEVWE